MEQKKAINSLMTLRDVSEQIKCSAHGYTETSHLSDSPSRVLMGGLPLFNLVSDLFVLEDDLKMERLLLNSKHITAVIK